MPSTQHEALVLLFRNHPAMAATLLQRSLPVPLPSFTEARIANSDRTQVRPATYQADLVVELREGDRAVAAIIVEVQLAVDRTKERTWPLYLASVRAELRCPAVLLVVAPDEVVARWARRPIALGHPGLALRPIVLSDADVPLVDDRLRAEREPELAVLSVLAHGDGPSGFGVALAAIHAIARLDEERSKTYSTFVLAALGSALRERLEREMKLGTFPEPTDLEKRILARGRLEGRAEGLLEGQAKGLLEGKAEGEVEGYAVALLTVLSARDFEVTEARRAAILSCRDRSELQRWIARAATVSELDDVFDER